MSTCESERGVPPGLSSHHSLAHVPVQGLKLRSWQSSGDQQVHFSPFQSH
jgi:hypothetical protein